MVTCHSLRVLNEELLGDPLDIKMFEFTNWSFEELPQKTNIIEEDVHQGPISIARPPVGLEYDVDFSTDSSIVCDPAVVHASAVANVVLACTY